MVTPDAQSQRPMTQNPPPAANHAPVAAFDFDGTITTHDSFMAFLRWRAGLFGYVAGLMRLIPASLAYLAHRDRGRIKAAAVAVFLKGVTCAKLSQDAERFANETAHSFFRPDALAAWRQHQTAGDRVVIVTASPELVVAPFAKQLGADLLIGTRLLTDAKGCISAGFDGLNCRGTEKVRRLKAVFGDDFRPIDAYGDTSGDVEMLAMAERGHMGLFTARP